MTDNDFDNALDADEIGFDNELDEISDPDELRQRDASGRPYARTTATIAAAVCSDYLEANNISTLRRTAPSVVADDLLGLINEEIWAQNNLVKEHTVVGRKLEPVKRLGFAEVARLMAALYSVISISPSSRNTDPDLNILAAYDDEPSSPHYGTYRSSSGHLRQIARRYQPDLTTKEFTEVTAALADSAPRVTRGQNRDLLAVRNGVIDYNAGKPIFMDFSPEYVFLSKLDVDWNPEATNIVIHNDEDGTDWDVESWMSELSDDSEIVNLFWEIIGATVRPYVSWNKAAFFFATSGNNGKGTLLSLMRNILGVSNYASIPLADFSRDFLLEPLTRASAILVDENDVGSYIDRSANLKAVITNDVITINRKYRNPISHQHFGFMVQCLNDKPTIKDKSESFYRRQLFVPFTKSFTGVERKYIKDDYLTRPEVLEYVLKRVLEMNYYSLSEPEAVKAALEDFKESNDPVRSFYNEVKYQFSWDLVPFQFAYDLYRGWLERNNPQAKPIGRNKFIDELVELVNSDPSGPFECPDKAARHRPGSRMAAPELLIVEFELQDWMNLSAPANNPTRRATMNPGQVKSVYRGLVRRDADPEPTSAQAADTPGQDTDTDVAQATSNETTQPVARDTNTASSASGSADTEKQTTSAGGDTGPVGPAPTTGTPSDTDAPQTHPGNGEAVHGGHVSSDPHPRKADLHPSTDTDATTMASTAKARLLTEQWTPEPTDGSTTSD